MSKIEQNIQAGFYNKVSEFGKGFSQRNLEQMRRFYSPYSKTQTPFAKFNFTS